MFNGLGPFILKIPKNLPKKNTVNPCEEIWLNGIQILPIDKKEAISIKGGISCRIQLNGKFLFIKTSNLDIDAFLDSLVLYETVPEEDGYYTWIIYSIDDGEKKIALNKVYSYIELGTKHNVLAHRIGATKIHAAGELKIENGVKNINLFSGSFMKDVFELRKQKREKRQKRLNQNNSSKNTFCDETMLEEYIENQLKTYFGEDGILRTYEFITKTDCPVKQEELDTYVKYGAEIQYFNTQNSCNEYLTESYKSINGGGKRKTKKNTQRKIKHKTRK